MKSFKKATRIFKYLKPFRFQYAAGIFLIMLTSVFTLGVTWLWGKLGGTAATNDRMPEVKKYLNFEFDLNSIGQIILLVAILLVVQAVLSFSRVYLFSWVTEKMMLALRRDTYQRIVQMPMQFFNENRVGELNSRISADVTSIQEIFTTTFSELVRQLIIIVFGISILVYSSPKLSLTMLSTLPVMMVVAVFIGRYIRNLGKTTQDSVADSNVIVQETFTGIVNVKAFVNEAFEVERYLKTIRAIRKYAMKSAVWRGLFGSFIILFVFGAISLLLYQGAKLREAGELDPDTFFFFLLLTGLVAGSIGGIAAQFGVLQKGIGAIENVMDLLDLDVEKIKFDHDHVSPIDLNGDIEFKNVNFRYESRKEVQVLSNISFKVNSGEQTAIVGSSGSGKSTIASLILQLYPVTEGAMLFDGKNSTEYELTDLRSHMAYVPQEVILFGGTIKDNIAYGKPNASEEDIELAAKNANALEFINKFPDGMDTIVGERGIQLSGGQRQRIAIARAMLNDPTVLILDEATSALDSESEKLVQDALDRLMMNRTSIVIAHRLSTIKNADQILVLEEGKIQESGTHNELMQSEKGVYKRLTELQLQNR